MNAQIRSPKLAYAALDIITVFLTYSVRAECASSSFRFLAIPPRVPVRKVLAVLVYLSWAPGLVVVVDVRSAAPLDGVARVGVCEDAVLNAVRNCTRARNNDRPTIKVQQILMRKGTVILGFTRTAFKNILEL